MSQAPLKRRIPWAILRRVTALGFLGLFVLSGRGVLNWFRGTTSASSLADRVAFTDPLAALEVSVGSGQLTSMAWLGAALLVVLALVFGPVFCGWLCPLGLVLDSVAALRRRLLGFLGVKHPAKASRPLGLRIFVLGLCLGLSLLARWPVFQTLSPINALVRWLAFGTDAALLFLGAVILLDLLIPRLWCRELCPQGALLALLGQRAPLRVRIDPARAGLIRCRRCDVACPMGIRVMEEYTLNQRESVDHPDCTRCGACIDSCPNGVLRLGWRSHPKRKPVSPPVLDPHR